MKAQLAQGWQSVREGFQKYQRNIGGAVSLAGSAGVALNAGPADLTAAGAFLAAEVTFIRFGRTEIGYAAGAALFSAGDLLLSTSGALADKPLVVRCALYGMSAAWGLGALSVPLKRRLRGNDPQAHPWLDAKLEAVVGLTNITLRVPAVLGAAAGASMANPASLVIPVSIGMWGLADWLLNRVGENVRKTGWFPVKDS